MADVKWIKIVTDIFDDEKILLIETLPEADSIIVIWFKLLCLAGKQNNSGVFVMSNGIPYTDKMLSTIFRRKETIVALALKTFEQFGMVEIVNDTLTIPNWGKHQNIEGIEARKEYQKLYQREYRARQRQLTEGEELHKCLRKQNVNALDKIREDKNREDSSYGEQSPPPKTTRFAIPSIDEVKAYCLERENSVDCEQFHNYYEANGWMVGKNKMKDWKAAVRTWEKNEKQPAQPATTIYTNART